jgi:Zn-dependent protease with chaperone function
MALAVYIPLLVPLLAAVGARPLAVRLPPAAAAWLLASGALALAFASAAALALLATSAVLRVGFVDSAGHLSAAVISRGDAVSVPVAVAAGALLVLAAVAAGRALWHRVRAIADAHRRARGLPGTGQVVVVEDAAADAYTLPGWPCRVVITQGMLSALSGRERQVLLAHERAHAGSAHYLFTSAARLAAAANPLLRPVAAEVGYTVERWADERAATEAGDRALTARAIARAALASSAGPPGRPRVLTALGITGPGWPGAGLRGAGPVPRRVAAMLAPPRGSSPLLLLVAAALVAVSAGCVLAGALSVHQLVELAQQPH